MRRGSPQFPKAVCRRTGNSSADAVAATGSGDRFRVVHRAHNQEVLSVGVIFPEGRLWRTPTPDVHYGRSGLAVNLLSIPNLGYRPDRIPASSHRGASYAFPRFPPPWICLPRQRARRAKSWPEATGNGMFCTLPMAAVIVEGVPMHLLLHRWSHVAAWISTGIGIYSFLWDGGALPVVGPAARAGERRSRGVAGGFLVACGVWPDRIRAVRRFSAADRGCLSLVVINAPQWIVELHEPVAVRGPLGRRKPVTRIALAVDDTEAFGAAFV